MDYSNAMNVGRNTKCVECMCLMTLFQEHISSKHSSHVHSAKHFELSEWQQAGYKQIIKWTLECDRCNFKTTSKIEMFEHIANHQVLENTVQRISQSAAGQPSSTPVSRPIPVRKEKALLHNLAIFPDYSANHGSSGPGVMAHGQNSHETSASHDSESDVPVKEERTESILIHMEEADISEVTRAKARKGAPAKIGTAATATAIISDNNASVWSNTGGIVAPGLKKTSTNPKPVNSRRSYTLQEKLILIEKSNTCGIASVAKEYNIDRTMLQRWKRAKDKIASIHINSTRDIKKCRLSRAPKSNLAKPEPEVPAADPHLVLDELLTTNMFPEVVLSISTNPANANRLSSGDNFTQPPAHGVTFSSNCNVEDLPKEDDNLLPTHNATLSASDVTSPFACNSTYSNDFQLQPHGASMPPVQDVKELLSGEDTIHHPGIPGF